MFRMLKIIWNDYRNLNILSKITVWVIAFLPRTLTILAAGGILAWAYLDYTNR